MITKRPNSHCCFFNSLVTVSFTVLPMFKKDRVCLGGKLIQLELMGIHENIYVNVRVYI